MAPSPPPSPSPSPSSSPDLIFTKSLVHVLRELGIMSSVVITIFLLFFLFFLGMIRRSVPGRYYVRYLTKISYLLVPISITYIMGVLHKDSEPQLLAPVWAAILIYAYGGVVTISACELSDNEETLRYVMRTLPLFFWTIWLAFLVFDLVSYLSLVALVCTLLCFLGLAVVNTRQTLAAFYKASKSKGLPREVEPLVRYMETQSKEPINVDTDHPWSMRGFKYIVWGKGKNATTLDEIWKWVTTDEEEVDEGEWDPTLLAKKQGFLAKCRLKDRLRDMCLSYALFRMLLIRFAGFPPISDSNPINPRLLIEEKLLRSMEPERVFRIIEVELDFLFDYFYTKSHVCGSYRFRDIWQNLAQILLIGLVAAFGIPIIVLDHLRYDSDMASVEVIVTWAILLKIILLESCKYIMVHFSNRKLVWLLCTGIRETASSDKWAHTTQKRIGLIWFIKSWLSSKFDVPLLCVYWPWQRKLGQYSFLKSYGKVPISARKPFSSLSRLVKLPRIGQRGDYVVPLSKQVKQAIISSLAPNGELKSSRRRYTDQLPSGCQPESNGACFILVWHIATSFCESFYPIQTTDPDHELFLVANQLSNYCAYLVAFAPELLPDHVYTTERTFDMAVEQANDPEMKSLNMNEHYQHLITRAASVNDDNIVARGAQLANQLSVQIMIGNTNRGWRLLGEFWANLLLYLAPSENVTVHGEYLARGGEFITHLWVLLTHAGVLTSNSSSSPI